MHVLRKYQIRAYQIGRKPTSDHPETLSAAENVPRASEPAIDPSLPQLGCLHHHIISPLLSSPLAVEWASSQPPARWICSPCSTSIVPSPLADPKVHHLASRKLIAFYRGMGFLCASGIPRDESRHSRQSILGGHTLPHAVKNQHFQQVWPVEIAQKTIPDLNIRLFSRDGMRPLNF
jgi:hypothetical protein